MTGSFGSGGALGLYEEHDGVALARLVRTGEVSRPELIDAALAVIERTNPATNAVVNVFPDIAQKLAERPLTDGPLAGVPILIKDALLRVEGTPLSNGSRMLKGHICDGDDTLAARYKSAGLLLLGRSNSPEFGLSFTTESATYGPCRNPWDTTRSPGGSSGGSAAAVAAAGVPIGHAGDGAGSIRVPAAHCGVFGLKPSRMRNPLGPANAEILAGLVTGHAVTRSVRDSAALLDISHGPDLGDPYAAPSFEGSYLAEIDKDPDQLKIGLVVTSPLEGPVTTACTSAAEDAARLCEALGHQVAQARLDYVADELVWAWRLIAGTSLARQVEAFQAANPEVEATSLLEPVNAEWCEEGRSWTARDYLRAVGVLHGTSRAMGRFFDTYDVLLSPVTAEPAPVLGMLAGGAADLDSFYARFWQHAPFTCVFNASGCPAMSVPLCWPERGVPIGVQFGAALGREDLLFRLAAQLERAQPWAHHYKRLRSAGV